MQLATIRSAVLMLHGETACLCFKISGPIRKR